MVEMLKLLILGERVFPPRPRAHPDVDVPEAVSGRTSDDFPGAHAWPVLVPTPRAGSMGGCARHANRGDSDRRLWVVYDTPRLGLGTVRLGLCAGFFPRE